MIENGMIVNQGAHDKQADAGGCYTCPNCGASLFGDNILYKVSGEVAGCEYCTTETDVWSEFGSGM